MLSSPETTPTLARQRRKQKLEYLAPSTRRNRKNSRGDSGFAPPWGPWREEYPNPRRPELKKFARAARPVNQYKNTLRRRHRLSCPRKNDFSVVKITTKPAHAASRFPMHRPAISHPPTCWHWRPIRGKVSTAGCTRRWPSRWRAMTLVVPSHGRQFVSPDTGAVKLNKFLCRWTMSLTRRRRFGAGELAAKNAEQEFRKKSLFG